MTTTLKVSAKADKVWARLAELYGKGFLTAAGKEPTPGWIDYIESLPVAHITRALRNLSDKAEHLEKNGQKAYPPSLVAFKAASKLFRENDPDEQKVISGPTSQDMYWAKHQELFVEATTAGLDSFTAGRMDVNELRGWLKENE
jgi:hypothetical protein